MSQEIKRLCLNNIMSMDFYIMSFAPIVALAGGNGSGKSLFLDCLSMICHGESPTRLNQASGQTRKLQGAVHWVTEKNKAGKRPGPTTSHIIAEMEDVNGNIFCQGIQAHSAGQGKQIRYTYFQSEGTLEEIHAGSKAELASGPRMDKAGDKNHMLTEFYARRGFQPQFIDVRTASESGAKYLDLCRTMFMPQMGTSDKGIRDIGEFVRKGILPPTNTTEKNRQIWSDIMAASEIREKLKQRAEKFRFIEQSVHAGRNLMEAKRAKELCAEVVPAVNKARYIEEQKKNNEAIAELESKVKEYKKEEASIKIKIKRVEEERREYDQKGASLKAARVELDAAETARSHAEETHKAALRHEALEASLKKRYEIASGEDIASCLDKKQENQIRQAEEKNRKVKETEAEMEERRNAISMLEGKFNGSTGRRKEGDERYMEDGKALCDAINAAIPGAKARMLYECIDEVKDPSWQDAAETVIGTDRFGVVVPPEYHDKAIRVQYGFKSSAGPTFILKTINLTSGPVRKARPGSIPGLFTYNDRYARYYMESFFGEVILCDDDDSFAKAKCALRKNGQHKGVKRTAKPGARRGKNMLLFGKKAILEEIRRQETQINRLRAERMDAEEKEENFRNKAAGIKKEIHTYLQSKGSYVAGAHDAYTKACERYQEANDKYNRIVSSDEEKYRQKKLKELDEKKDRLEGDRDTYHEKEWRANSEIKEHKEANQNINKWLKDRKDVPEKTKNYNEEDEAIIEEYALRRCMGDINENLKKQEIDKQIVERRKAVSNILSNTVMLETFIEAPAQIETKKDLDYYEEQYDTMWGTDARSEDIKELERVEEGLRQMSVELINMMGREYENARKMREKFNGYISKYRIGKCYYRISEISINPHAHNAEIMGYALKLSDGIQLTENEMQNIQALAKTAWSSGREKEWNVFDNRRYVTTSLECRAEGSEYWGNAKKVIENNSTGQNSALKYICLIAVIAHQTFTDKSVNVILCDESLAGVDRANGWYFFNTLRKMNIQCILAYWNPIWYREVDLMYFIRKDENDFIKIGPAAMPKKANAREEVA